GQHGDERSFHAQQVDRYTNRMSEFASNLTAGHNRGRRQLLFTATKGGRKKSERLLKEFNIPFADDRDVLGPEIVVTPGALARGFDFEDINVTVYSEWVSSSRRLRRGSVRSAARPMHS